MTFDLTQPLTLWTDHYIISQSYSTMECLWFYFNKPSLEMTFEIVGHCFVVIYVTLKYLKQRNKQY